ncbi:TetR/AcrR family transcriptional regulator [Svornostia abyssi]|uniref:TetR/AcrR family transcriptional regulator n=1 Tax=Svornostia abyssi TaxID=2898438 RepID=A0ABY5PLP4_9ACTN|nr:TetR/AcrR family transcriptional regulator [Parviterribacteraceae bacterium J379]
MSDVLETPTGTRDRLLAAALEITREGGYGAASVVAIADRAGVAAGTLYRHFPSKGELFAELFRTVCSGEVEAMRAADPGPSATATARAEEVIATFAGRALHTPRLAWALIAEPVDPLVDAERLAYREAYRELLATLVRAGIEDGSLPPQDADLTAAAIVGGVGEALVGPTSPLSGAAPDAQEIVRALRIFVRRALGAARSDQEETG